MKAVALGMLILAAADNARGEAGWRSAMSRAEADQRTLGVALESYKIDFGAYPPAAPGERVPYHRLTTPLAYVAAPFIDPLAGHRVAPMPGAFGLAWPTWICIGLGIAAYAGVELLTRRCRKKSRWQMLLGSLARLTVIGLACPVIYVAWYMDREVDGLALEEVAEVPEGERIFYYATDGRRLWVLQSVGPDGIRELESLAAIVSEEGSRIALIEQLAPAKFDPTNGLISSGDLFRVAEPEN